MRDFTPRAAVHRCAENIVTARFPYPVIASPKGAAIHTAGYSGSVACRVAMLLAMTGLWGCFKKIWLVMILAGVALVLSGCGEEQWLDHRGNPVTRADLDERWVVVNYWAEWCAPCLHELPEFNSLAEGNPEVLVFGVNYDGISGDELLELSDRMGIEFAVMGQDFEQSLELKRPAVLPTTYIFDPQGELQYSLPGPQTEESLLVLLK